VQPEKVQINLFGKKATGKVQIILSGKSATGKSAN
jgi:hypothetical protein